MAEKYFVTVYNSKDDVDDDFAPVQGFWVNKDDMELFLKICRENGKYVIIDLDYTKG